MENRITRFDDPRPRREDSPQPIGEILAELLARYQIRFPEVQITIVETPATVA